MGGKDKCENKVGYKHSSLKQWKRGEREKSMKKLFAVRYSIRNHNVQNSFTWGFGEAMGLCIIISCIQLVALCVCVDLPWSRLIKQIEYSEIVENRFELSVSDDAVVGNTHQWIVSFHSSLLNQAIRSSVKVICCSETRKTSGFRERVGDTLERSER